MGPGDGLDLMFNSLPCQSMGSLGRPASMEGLNRVNRQPSKKVNFYRQPSKMKVDIDCPKISSHFSLLVFQLIIMDFWLLKNPAPKWKTTSHVLKNTPSRLYKTLEIAYI